MQAHRPVAPRLEVRALACRRGARVLVAGVGFTLGPGAALQVAGPNGIGKSTLLRTLAGLTAPFAGTVIRTGATGLLDDRTALDPDRPLAAALAFWQLLDGAEPGLGNGALALGPLGEVPVRYLSTGQAKRAGLARLAGQGAPIWLLDEPLNGLDPDGARACVAMVAAHCDGGGIAVIASHQPFPLPRLDRLDLAAHVPASGGDDGQDSGFGGELDDGGGAA